MDDMEHIVDPHFKEDPLYMKSLIGKEIEVKTVNKKAYKGFVYVIDPIFKTVVLHCNRKSESEYDTVIIMHHAIETLCVLSDEVNQWYLQTTKETVNSNITRKDSVKKWLQHMQINVAESGDILKVDDHLIILPPYELENCVSNNTIILERVRNILDQMPPDST
ncbi:unnamed protein product [Acanthoscelides obtectus]|uniref:AD domain-containing protein n=1 Tax=Acanthoscelides obtectus TaxID=200917 RepID=A0A9P0LX59_ACAOB|nr:unnamed protein product [Acanthoscelides obtectus]CAK1678117.1 Gem-associated protein 6 [Acanthoscelides obtectus]